MNPNEMYAMDLSIFAAASGMKLTHSVHSWRAFLEIDGQRIEGTGSRPILATEALYRKVIDRHYEGIEGGSQP